MTLAETIPSPSDQRLLLDWLVTLARAYRDFATRPLALLDLAEREAHILLVADCEEHDLRGVASSFLAAWIADEHGLEVLAYNVVEWVQRGVRPLRWSEPPAGWVKRSVPPSVSIRRHRGVETYDEARVRSEREAVERLQVARATAEERRRTRPHEADRERAYGRAALDGACAEVLGAVQGSRHTTLNRAAWGIGRLVGGGVLQEEEAREALCLAGADIGLGARDVARIVTRALGDGATKAPRGMPEDRDLTREGGVR